MSSCDHVWVPKCPSNDLRLIKTMSRFVSNVSETEIETAFEHLVSAESGLNQSQSLVDDLLEKSGEISHQYIREALMSLQNYVVRGSAASEIRRVLLCDIRYDSDDLVWIDLYRGCIWDLFASLVVLLLAEGDKDAPASCFDAIARTRYLETKLYSIEKN